MSEQTKHVFERQPEYVDGGWTIKYEVLKTVQSALEDLDVFLDLEEIELVMLESERLCKGE